MNVSCISISLFLTVTGTNWTCRRERESGDYPVWFLPSMLRTWLLMCNSIIHQYNLIVLLKLCPSLLMAISVYDLLGKSRANWCGRASGSRWTQCKCSDTHTLIHKLHKTHISYKQKINQSTYSLEDTNPCHIVSQGLPGRPGEKGSTGEPVSTKINK